MELDENQGRQLDFNQDMDLMEEQGEEEHKVGRNLFLSHNPSNSMLFNDEDLILGKGISHQSFD
jgi:hypothetical protein